MRGENGISMRVEGATRGTSPRARGKPQQRTVIERKLGNIPACAGKTKSCWGWRAPQREHPRVRGENKRLSRGRAPDAGTSPRARGKLPRHPRRTRTPGNIPACAGKTLIAPMEGGKIWEHPRVRGENTSGNKFFARALGTSPRARGKPSRGARFTYIRRNIPACAGKTGTCDWPGREKEEHPRVRGENTSRMLENLIRWGTSPRARGKLRGQSAQRDCARNIPACAGKTPMNREKSHTGKEHPRVRGENAPGLVGVSPERGTSPRARGKRADRQLHGTA